MKNIILVSLILLLSAFSPDSSVQRYSSNVHDIVESDQAIKLTGYFWAQKINYEGYQYIKLFRFDDKGFANKSTFYRFWRVRINPDGSKSPYEEGIWGIGSWTLNDKVLTMVPYNDFAKTDGAPITYKIVNNHFEPTNPQGVTKDVPYQQFTLFLLSNPPKFIPPKVVERMRDRFRTN